MDQRQQMQTAIAVYFPSEKQASLLLFAIGIAAIGASLALYLQNSQYLGMGIPLTAIAIIQIAVGGRVFFRTDSQVRSLKARLAASPSGKALRELDRMKGVVKSFRIYRVVEIALLVISVASSIPFRGQPLLFSGSLGLAAQALLMLLFDMAAERRAKVYIEALVAFVRAVS